jgi:hypothetical protein
MSGRGGGDGFGYILVVAIVGLVRAVIMFLAGSGGHA